MSSVIAAADFNVTALFHRATPIPWSWLSRVGGKGVRDAFTGSLRRILKVLSTSVLICFGSELSISSLRCPITKKSEIDSVIVSATIKDVSHKLHYCTLQF